MYCVATPNLFATSFSCPFASGVCRDIIFLVVTNIFLFSLSTLSRQDFFESLAISVATRNSLVTTDFSSLILVVCLAVCHDIEIFVATCLIISFCLYPIELRVPSNSSWAEYILIRFLLIISKLLVHHFSL